MTEKGTHQQIVGNAIELLQALRDPDVISLHNKELVEKCAEQIRELYDENIRTLMDLKSDINRDENMLHMIRIRQTAIEQIKRCCCAYINERISRLKHLRWKFGGHLPENLKANLSEQELKWLSTYNELTFNFQYQFVEGGAVNLLNHVDPPEKLLVKVRALEDSGKFETGDGTNVVLNKGTFHLLPKQDCENLVRRGVLEYVKQ